MNKSHFTLEEMPKCFQSLKLLLGNLFEEKHNHSYTKRIRNGKASIPANATHFCSLKYLFSCEIL